MVSKMRCGLAGIIVVDRTIIIVMMAFSLQVFDLVRDVKHAFRRQQSALHGEAMQRQKQQQEDAQEATHERISRESG